MRSAAFALLALLVAAPALGQESGVPVRLAFNEYRDLALAGDGPGVLGAVSASTVAYYDQAIEAALDADSAAVAGLPFMDRLLVLSLRLRMRPADLRRTSGAEVLTTGVEKGWIDPGAMARMDIGDVDVEGDLAVGRLVREGTPLMDTWLRFAREGGKWKVDLSSLADVVSYAVESAGPSGPAPDALLALMLEGIADGPLPGDLWRPVGR